MAKSHKALFNALNNIRQHELTAELRLIIDGALCEIETMNARISIIEKQLQLYITQSPAAKIIQSLPGIGMINASAFSAAIDKGQAFKSEKEAQYLCLKNNLNAFGLEALPSPCNLPIVVDLVKYAYSHQQ